MDALSLLALEIFEISKAMYDRFADAAKGKVTPEAVRAELAAFRKQLTANDAAADAELHKRFQP